MLIRLEPLQCAADLTLVLQAVQRLFALIVKYENYDDGDPFPVELTEDKDIEFLLRYQQVRTSVSQLLKASVSERKELARVFLNDSEFQRNLEDPAFLFLFASLPASVLLPAQELLRALYDDILAKTGFRDLQGQATPTVNRHTFEAAYRESNRGRESVCSGCLGLLERPVGAFVLTDCEHFFPQHAFPTLTVHPLNLVILCTTCNQRAHRKTLPIGDQPGSIRDTFIPYVRAGLDEMTLAFRPASTSGAVRLEGNNHTPHSAARVSSFDRVYLLSDRWSHRLQDYIHGALIRGIKKRYKNPGVAEVAEYLEEKATLSIEEQLQAPDDFLRCQYARWILEHRLTVFVSNLVIPP